MKRAIQLELKRRYWMRNGSLVHTIKTFDVTWHDRKTKKRCSETLYLGQLVGHSGERISWHADGRYSPLRHDHPLDIVRTARRKPRK